VMALKFIGHAIQEFQEQQYISYTDIGRAGPWLEMLGFNPTVEAVAAQAFVIVLAILTFVVLDRRGRQAAVQQQARKA
jgi:high-affinity iron transporter